MNLELLPYVCLLTLAVVAISGIALFLQIQSTRWQIIKLRENEEQGKYEEVEDEWTYGRKAWGFALSGIFMLFAIMCVLPIATILLLKLPDLWSSKLFWAAVSIPVVISLISGAWVNYQIYFPK